MRNKARSIVFLLLCSTSAVSAFAFWSIGVFVHQTITATALTMPVYKFSADGSGTGYSFSPKAIGAIQDMHYHADLARLYGYNATDHFDDESFQSSYQVLSDRYGQLENALNPNVNGAVDRDTAWMVLGLMLHSVQDFYAHSNWVNSANYLFPPPIVNFGTSISPGASLSFLLAPNAIGPVCQAGGVTLDIPIPNITTGYYMVMPLPDKKCQHGNESLRNQAGSCLFNTQPDGINHDAACIFATSDTIDRQIFAKASDLATQESIALVQAIVQDLVTKKNGPGFCALLDLPSNTPMCSVNLSISPPAATVAVGSTFTLSVSATDGAGNPTALPPNLNWSSTDQTLATVLDAVVAGVAIPATNLLQPIITVTDPASGATSSVTVLVTGPNWLGTYAGTACAGTPGENPNFQAYVLDQSGASLLWSDSGDYPIHTYTRSLSSNGLVASWYADDGSLISTWTLSGKTMTVKDAAGDCDNGDVFTLIGPPPG